MIPPLESVENPRRAASAAPPGDRPSEAAATPRAAIDEECVDVDVPRVILGVALRLIKLLGMEVDVVEWLVPT